MIKYFEWSIVAKKNKKNRNHDLSSYQVGENSEGKAECGVRQFGPKIPLY